MKVKELKPYQARAARQIADRYVRFVRQKAHSHRKEHHPYFQILSAITGSGKTAILCYALRIIWNQYKDKGQGVPMPIVLWTTKSRAVVLQTHNSLLDNRGVGGLLAGLNCRMEMLRDIKFDHITERRRPLIAISTLAAFHRKGEAQREKLRAHRKGAPSKGDAISASLWESLKQRGRRPLLIVYDESHNFNYSQAETLSELNPQGYILASGTATVPKQDHPFYKKNIHPAASVLRSIWRDKDDNEVLITKVNSNDAVDAALVKRAIHLHGTTANMESCIRMAYDKWAFLKKESEKFSWSVSPKAVYVCKTNLSDSGKKDAKNAEFEDRKARAIVLWRHLTKCCNVHSDSIAIYADVEASKGKLPANLHLYNQKEKDFHEFAAKDYRHIIFNLALQEGWDDPACYVAYIDKTMNSHVQIRQIIGRILRQPGAQFCKKSEALNTAHFYVRVDRESAFEEVIENLKKELHQKDGMRSVAIRGSFGKTSTQEEEIVSPRRDVRITRLIVNSESIEQETNRMMLDCINDVVQNRSYSSCHSAKVISNTIHTAEPDAKAVPQNEDSPAPDSPVPHGESELPSTQYPIWWAIEELGREMDRRVTELLGFSQDGLMRDGFREKIAIGSPAWEAIRAMLKDIAKRFYADSCIQFDKTEPHFRFNDIAVLHGVRFKNSLYEKYEEDTMNDFEKKFASALDKNDSIVWHRNAEGPNGYSIPLLLENYHKNYFPDFLVWKSARNQRSSPVKNIVCVDTKGGHLLDDALPKLKDIRESRSSDGYKIFSRMLTKGRGRNSNAEGYSVWSQPEQGEPVSRHFVNMSEAIEDMIQKLDVGRA